VTFAPVLAPLSVAIERGPIRWAAAPPGWVVVLLLAVVALCLRAIYKREEGRIGAPMRLFLAFLRLLAVALVLAALFKPFREEVHKTEDKSRLFLLVDTSASMRTVDRYRPEDEAKILDSAYPDDGPDRRPSELRDTRLALVKRVLPDSVLEKLADRFVVEAFAFDEDLRSLGSTDPSWRPPDGGGEELTPAQRLAAIGRTIRALEANGSRTELGSAIATVAREAVGRDDRRIAGVVVLTDGRDNGATQSGVETVRLLGRAAEEMRVTAVALGDPTLAKNLKVDHVTAPDEVLVQDEPTFQVELRQTGFDGLDGVEVRLEIVQVAGADQKPLPTPIPYAPKDGSRMSAKVRLLPADKPTAVLPALQAAFDKAGTFDVTVRARLPRGHEKEDAVPEDDVKVHHLRVVDSTIKVLLVDHALRHESHFLKNLLVRESRHAGDPHRVDAQVWIQTFDKEVEQPHGAGMKALRAFPATKPELFAYDVIILGDIAWHELAPTREQSTKILQMLKEFVAEGGGLAFVAGEDNVPDQLASTPLADVLPVVTRASDRSIDLPRSFPFRIAPTEAGRTHPILSVRQQGNPDAVERAWRDRDTWQWYWAYRATGGLKPGAFALARISNATGGAEYRDERGELLPIFVGMSYGKGRVFFSAVDQIYRIRREYGDVYYGSFWDETIRWLATYRLLGGNKRYKIETDKEEYFVGDQAVVRVSALDTDYSPLKASKLDGFQVEDPDGRPMFAPGDEPVRDESGAPGLYRTQVRLPRSGTYRIMVSPPARDGGERAEKRIEARFATKEAQDTVPDHETLAAIVRMTHPAGSAHPLVHVWDAKSALDALPPRTTERVSDRQEIQIWDTSTTLLLVVAVLALEWILRKRAQLI